VNPLVLSGTATLVPSGTRSSCYRGLESVLSVCYPVHSSLSNCSNQKSIGFLLTDCAIFLAVHNPPRDRRARSHTLDLRVYGAAS